MGIAQPKVSNGLEKGGREGETVKEVGVKKREEGGNRRKEEGHTHHAEAKSGPPVEMEWTPLSFSVHLV